MRASPVMRPSGRRAASARRRGALAALGRALFWLVELPVAGAVAVGLAAAFLPPGPFWWAQIIAVGLPYAAWALGAWTVVALAASRWRVLLLHVVLLGLVFGRTAPLARQAPASEAALAADDVFSVMTFNIPASGPSREALGDSVEAFMARAAPDLLGFQDAWVVYASRTTPPERAVQVEAVEDGLPYRLLQPPPAADDASRGGTPVPLLARRGVAASAHAPLVLEPGLDLEVRGTAATRTVVTWQGRPFALYNVHLRSFGSDQPWRNDTLRAAPWRDRLTRDVWRRYTGIYRQVYPARAAEADALARAIEADSLPVVVMGDLNSAPDNWSARRLRTAGVRRTDAQRAAGAGWGRTYHARRPLVRIDAVYADPAFEVLAARTYGVGFSDHRPVHAWLRWRDGS